MATNATITLTKRQYKQYVEIKNAFENQRIIGISDVDYVRLKDVLVLLEMLEYIRPIEIDNTNAYRLIGNFKDFEAWHKDMIREARKITKREWRIAIISAIVGAIIGLIPTVVSCLQ